MHSQLVRDFIRLGLEAGDMGMVHSSIGAVGKVLGGPDVVIRALLARIPHIKVVLVVLPCVNVPLEMEMSDPAMMVWEAPHG